MNGSESSWSEERLLEEMEAMQDQIEQLQGRNTGLEAELSTKENLIQKLSFEKSDLLLAVQELKRKLQEQTECIGKLNGELNSLQEKCGKLNKEACDAARGEWNANRKLSSLKKAVEDHKRFYDDRAESMEKTYKNKLQCGLNAMKYQLEEEKQKLKKINSDKIKALKRSYRRRMEDKDELFVIAMGSALILLLLAGIISGSFMVKLYASVNFVYVTYLAFKSSPFRKEEKQAPVKQIQQKTNRKKVSQPVRQP